MTVNQAIEQLLEVENRRKEGAYGEDTLCVGLSRVGQKGQIIAAGTMKQLLTYDFGEPLHSLVLVGTMHYLEEEILAEFDVAIQS